VQFSELQDRVIQHTIVHQSTASIYTPNFTEIGKTFVYRQTDISDPL